MSSPLRPDDREALRRFVIDNTVVAAPPLLPELPLHLATEVTPLWRATQATLDRAGVEPPFWAFAWAGGQALARLLLDQPSLVAGKRVLDFATGSGLVALAAARAGASEVVAVDLDPLAIAATQLNAERLGLRVEPRLGDALAPGVADGRFDLITAGDVCYDAGWARAALAWLRARAAEGASVLLGDPGRAYAPAEGVEVVASYVVPVIDDVEGSAEKASRVLRLSAR